MLGSGAPRIVAALVAGGMALGLSLAFPRAAGACTCLPSDFYTRVGNAEAVVHVRVLRERLTGEFERTYTARVVRSYKGCFTKGQRVRLVTPSQSAGCGIELRIGEEYVVSSGRFDASNRLTVSLCAPPSRAESLTPEQIDFLDSRQDCCGDECRCANSEPVQCLVDPCDVTTCAEGACTANFCGGCRAEFALEDGRATCQPCTSDRDCRPFEQRCGLDGRCTRACSSDADCGPGRWCATLGEDRWQCLPLARLGDSCGGDPALGNERRCREGLFCEPRNLERPELGGRCRRSCTDSDDCPSGQYCSASLLASATQGALEPRICRGDGTCATTSDCFDRDNTYPAPACVGALSCRAKRCAVTCGPACNDMAGIDLGPCFLLLGYAPVGGTCQAVGGCSGRGSYFFPSLETCQQACEP